MAANQNYEIELPELPEPSDGSLPILADHDSEQLWFKEEEVCNFLVEHDRSGYADDEEVMAYRAWLATLKRLHLHLDAAHSPAMTGMSAGDVVMYCGAQFSESDMMMDGQFALEDKHFIAARTENLVDCYDGDDQLVYNDLFDTIDAMDDSSSPSGEFATASSPITYSMSVGTPSSKSLAHT